MKPTLISISADDRLTARVERRSATEAFDELVACITSFNRHLENLAKSFPGAVGIGIFAGGHSPGALVLTYAGGDWQHSPVAVDRLQRLAWVVGHLPVDLREAFEAALREVKR